MIKEGAFLGWKGLKIDPIIHASFILARQSVSVPVHSRYCTLTHQHISVSLRPNENSADKTPEYAKGTPSPRSEKDGYYEMSSSREDATRSRRRAS